MSVKSLLGPLAMGLPLSSYGNADKKEPTQQKVKYDDGEPGNTKGAGKVKDQVVKKSESRQDSLRPFLDIV